MPVVGHVFVGLATAVAVGPGTVRSPGKRRFDGWWAAALVALAYLPDVATQLFEVAGLAARAACHSWSFAFGVATVGAIAWSVVGKRAVSGFLVAGGSVWLHDVADLLQGSPASPLWPIPYASAHISGVISDNIVAEVAIFGGLLGMSVAFRLLWGRREVWGGFKGGLRRDAAALLVIGALTGIATLTSVMRQVRTAHLERATTLIAAREYRSALAALDQSARWPRAGKPGRIDHLRAESYAGLRQVGLAELYYRRALEADPRYFWALADLAVLYAEWDGPIEVRDDRVGTIVTTLRREFAHHRALPAVLDRIERRLADRQ